MSKPAWLSQATDRKIGIDSAIVSHIAFVRSPFLNRPDIMEAAMGKDLFQVPCRAVRLDWPGRMGVSQEQSVLLRT